MKKGKTNAPEAFQPPVRSDYDEGMLGDTSFEWAMERWKMENHKLGPGYAASYAADLKSGREDTRINQSGVKQTGTSMKLK